MQGCNGGVSDDTEVVHGRYVWYGNLQCWPRRRLKNMGPSQRKKKMMN